MTRHYTITGSATSDGSPIYLRADGTWTLLISEACATPSELDRDRLVRAARSSEAVVCDPYAIEVQLDRSQMMPVRFRERIRATGPTVGLVGRH
jgi:hypothetical protein